MRDTHHITCTQFENANSWANMWRNRPFYTGSRAVCHHLKSSGKFRSSNSIKPVVRRVSRRIWMNQITRIDMHRKELMKELTTMITTLGNLYKHNLVLFTNLVHNK